MAYGDKIMSTVSVREAQARLSELIRKLKPDDEVVITENDEPVARLLPASARPKKRTLGSLRGTVTHMAADFDAPLHEFREYME
jgi:prevent-host-death family protein